MRKLTFIRPWIPLSYTARWSRYFVDWYYLFTFIQDILWTEGFFPMNSFSKRNQDLISLLAGLVKLRESILKPEYHCHHLSEDCWILWIFFDLHLVTHKFNPISRHALTTYEKTSVTVNHSALDPIILYSKVIYRLRRYGAFWQRLSEVTGALHVNQKLPLP